MELSWWNFRTQEHDRFGGLPEDFSDYIPQSSAAQNLYKLLVEHTRKSPAQAAIHILGVGVGNKNK